MIKMKAEQVILSRQLPKTGRYVSGYTGDDGYHQAGWWKGLTVADNKTRHILKTIGGDDVVEDLATGLMWAADGNEAGCNSGNKLNLIDAIAFGVALNFAGFTDWRLPNVFELFSLLQLQAPAVHTYEPPFSNTYAEEYWTSSRYAGPSGAYFIVHFFRGGAYNEITTNTYRVRCVRGGL